MIDDGSLDMVDLQSGEHRVVVSLSSGASSAVAAERCINRIGKERVELVFMDTTWEDGDNYRFLRDLQTRWQMPITTLRDGRTPLDVADDVGLIPNQKIAPCTRVLKIEPFVRHIKAMLADGHSIIVALGMAWSERHRMAAPRKHYGAIGARVVYPLLWAAPVADSKAVVKSWGIDLPRMYSQGYKHANCGGRCVKQGKRDWRRTLTHYPDRYRDVEAWETEKRKDARFADRAMLRDNRGGNQTYIPLSAFREEIEQRDEQQGRLFDMFEDMAGCSEECGAWNITSG